MYSLSNKKSFKMNIKAMHDYCFRFACLKRDLYIVRVAVHVLYIPYDYYPYVLCGVAILHFSYLLLLCISIRFTRVSKGLGLKSVWIAREYNILYQMLIIEVHRTSSETTCSWCKIQYRIYNYLFGMACM